MQCGYCLQGAVADLQDCNVEGASDRAHIAARVRVLATAMARTGSFTAKWDSCEQPDGSEAPFLHMKLEPRENRAAEEEVAQVMAAAEAQVAALPRQAQQALQDFEQQRRGSAEQLLVTQAEAAAGGPSMQEEAAACSSSYAAPEAQAAASAAGTGAADQGHAAVQQGDLRQQQDQQKGAPGGGAGASSAFKGKQGPLSAASSGQTAVMSRACC